MFVAARQRSAPKTAYTQPGANTRKAAKMHRFLAKNVVSSLALCLAIVAFVRADAAQPTLPDEYSAAALHREVPPASSLENPVDSARLGNRRNCSPWNWPIDQPPLSDLEQPLFADAADGQLHEFSLLDAALIASGVKDASELQRYRELVAAWAAEIKRGGGSSGSPRRRVEAMFAFIHRKILVGHYDINCTDLRTALEQGNFNCVSATTLFNCLGNALGLPCCALETPGHALSRVALPDGPLNIETTCPEWFHLKHDQLKQSQSPDKRIGRESADDEAALHEISQVQLTAMIYYNRGIDYLGEKRFAEAAAANAKALRLDPLNDSARGNLLATINNWALDLVKAGNFDDAVALLRQGLAIDPHYEAFTANFVHAHHQWSQALCQAGRYKEAVEILDRGASELPENPYFRGALWHVYGSWAVTLLKIDKMDEAFDILRFVN